MISEHQQLVARIREFIRSSAHTVSPAVEELAERYANLCEEINQRLEKCADFLEKGMRSEAVYEAQLAPSLFELVEVVQFAEGKKWQNFCKENDLPVPPAIEQEVITRLRSECGTEELLSPLLKQYRRLVHEGTAQERISILRQIRDKDPDNPVWEENLRPLEEEQLEELAAAAEQALQDRDLAQLRYLYDELSDSRRALKPPEELIHPIQDTLGEFAAQDAADQIRSKLAELDPALADDDEQRVRELLQDCEKLQEQAKVTPDAAMKNAFDKAHSYIADKEKKQQEENQYQQAKEELWQAVAATPPDPASIRRCWEALASFEREIPESLRAQTQAVLDRVRRKDKARRRMIAAGIGLCVLVAIILGAYYVHTQNRAKRREAVLAKVESLLSAQAYSEAREYLNRVTEANPSLLTRDRTARLNAEIEQGIEERNDRQRRFRSARHELSRIREEGFTAPEEQQEEALQTAMALAETAEQEKRVREWQEARADVRRERREEANQRLRAVIAAAEEGVEKQEESGAFASLQAEKDFIQDLRDRLREAEQWREAADKTLAERHEQLTAILANWNKTVSERISLQQSREEKKQSLLNTLYQPLPDINAYADKLEQLVSDFSKIPRASEYERALNQIDIYREVPRLHEVDLRQIPPSAAQLSTLREITGDMTDSGLWHRDLTRVLDYAEQLKRVPKQLRELKDIPTVAWKVLRYRRKGEETWKELFYNDRIRYRDEGKYKVYWGEVFRFSAEREDKWLVHTSEIFEEGLTTEEYEVELADIREHNFMPQGEFVRRILRDVSRHERLDMFLIDKIEELVKDESVRYIPKARLLENLVSTLHQCAITRPPMLQRLHRQVNDLPTKVHWYFEETEAVKNANTQIKQTLAEWPDMSRLKTILNLSQELLRQALSRQVKWAGYVRNTDENGLRPVVAAGPVAEVWALSSEGSGNVSCRVVGVQSEDEYRFIRSEEQKLYAGQLLFAPDDGRRTNDLVKEVLNSFSDEMLREAVWPASWPQNARSPSPVNTE